MVTRLLKSTFFALEPVVTNIMRYPARLKQRPGMKAGLSILMYHSIPDKADNIMDPYYDLRVPIDSFTAQMQFLHDNSYNVIDLGQYVRVRAAAEALPAKAVAITFDDGYQDNYSNAWPVLKRFGFPGTVFLAPDLIDRGPRSGFFDQSTGLDNSISFLRWGQVQEMSAGGMSFGSHTMSHPRLDELAEDEFTYEISASKNLIEEKIEKEIECFCFPYAFPGGKKRHSFRAASKRLLENCDYKLGVTTTIGQNGPGDCIFFLKRIPVHANDSVRRFAAKLEGGYNWVRGFQAFSKTLESRRGQQEQYLQQSVAGEKHTAISDIKE